MKLRHIYLALCLVGLLVPNSLFYPWLLAHGPNPQRFLGDMFANGVSAFFAMDVVVSAVALGAFILIEGARLRLRGRWASLAATLLVGVSLGLPLFLYQRQLHLDRTTVA